MDAGKGRARPSSAAWLLSTFGVAWGAACSMAPPDMRWPSGLGSTTAPSSVEPPVIPTDSFVTLNGSAAAHSELCAADDQHPRFPDDADMVTKTFCQDLKPGGAIPTPRGLDELLKQFGLDFKDPNGGNGSGGNPAFAILGHSSALTARMVSTIAPTAFIFTPPPADGSKPSGYTILAFDPGEHFVEVASHDPTKDEVNFYLIMFDQACTHGETGCSHADMLTPKLLTGWSDIRIYEDTTSLGNTVFDCHVCHQPDNNQPPILRMQEIAPPFTHWFSASTEGGRALLADFHAAHPANETYGGIPAPLIDKSDPRKLAQLITQAGFGKQPNAFASSAIEDEVKGASPGQPLVNVPPGTSSSWRALYDRAAAGEFIAPPYHDVKVTDPEKLARMSRAYGLWASGAAQELPDIRDVFLDDGLRDMGFAPKLGLDGRGLLVQMCQECHHSKLDMMLSREAFLVDRLDQMSRKEKDLAIERISMPEGTRLRMPPTLFRSITSEERQRMIEELQK